jgi:spore maturation protein CgeB
MKILLSGSDHTWSIERIYVKYLQEFAAGVKLFPAQNYFYEYYRASFINKVIYKTGISTILKKINEKLKEDISQFMPDVVWVFKGMEIFPDTLKHIKDKGIFLVNYNPDNPFIFSGAGSGNDNIKKSISIYDLHFTYNLEIKKQLEMMGCKTAMLPFGFDLSESLYKQCCAEKEIIKTCFLGNPDKQRARFVKNLAEEGVEMDIYGHYWKQFIKHPRVNLFPPVYGDEFWKVLYRYRIQLNLMRPHNEHSHNMRSFEIPAAGGIMLAPDTPEHRLFFDDGKEVFLYSGISQCLSRIEYLLALPKDEAEQLRRNARERSVSSGYSYKERALASLQYFENHAQISNHPF